MFIFLIVEIYTQILILWVINTFNMVLLCSIGPTLIMKHWVGSIILRVHNIPSNHWNAWRLSPTCLTSLDLNMSNYEFFPLKSLLQAVHLPSLKLYIPLQGGFLRSATLLLFVTTRFASPYAILHRGPYSISSSSPSQGRTFLCREFKQ